MGSLDLMQRREEEIGKLVQLLGEQSNSFTKPKLVVIGGYALRAFVPFARYSRDCDFALQKGLETVRAWRPHGVSEESFEQFPEFGFMRWSNKFGLGKKKIPVGIDFMEGQVRGRQGEVFAIDDRFLADSKKTELKIAGRSHAVWVASYADLFVMKVVSGRDSDVRDIAALVWKNGAPDVSASLASLHDPKFFHDNLRARVIPEIEGKNFLNSWRGMFITEEFAEEDRKKVVAAIRRLVGNS